MKTRTRDPRQPHVLPRGSTSGENPPQALETLKNANLRTDVAASSTTVAGAPPECAATFEGAREHGSSAAKMGARRATDGSEAAALVARDDGTGTRGEAGNKGSIRMGALGRFAFDVAPRASAAPTSLREILDALGPAARALSNVQSAAFLADPQGVGEFPGLAHVVDATAPYIDPTDRELIDVEKAQQAPQTTKMGTGPGRNRGGITVWRNDVYPADFFVKHHAAVNLGLLPANQLRERAAEQPWFEWKPETRSYEFHAHGAQHRILEQLETLSSSSGDAPRLQLYRGTTAYESLLFSLQRALAEDRLPPDWRNQLTSAMQQIVDHTSSTLKAWEELLDDKSVDPSEVEPKREAFISASQVAADLEVSLASATSDEQIGALLQHEVDALLRRSIFAGLFVTLDPARASDFSKGFVVSFDVSVEDLKKLLARSELYAGFEAIGDSTAVELAFLPSATGNVGELTELLARSYRGSEQKEAGNLFN